MEPRRDESEKRSGSEPREPHRKNRFQIVKLEERIAPNKGGIPHNGHKYSLKACPY